MNALLRSIVFATATFVITVPAAHSQDPDFAKDLAEEGVSNEAKIEFVRVLHDPSKKAAYAEAHYYLGYMSFQEKHYDRALLHWNLLAKEYPESPYAQKAQEQIRLAYSLLSKQQELTGENIEIDSLFDNADLFVGEPLKVMIDTRSLSNGDLAVEWLEAIVTKFPTSADAPRALFREALVYYGWGNDSTGYGFKYYHFYTLNNKAIELTYIGKMADVLSRLEKQYPDSQYAIPVAFLVGQAYWEAAGGKIDENARTYWNKVLSLTQNDDASSYRQIAERRLK